MKITRRRALLAGAAMASTPMLGGCGGKAFTVEIDQSLPVGPHGPETTAEAVTRGLDLSGQVALVTGCNSGLGYETMRVLALRGAHVLGTGRTMEKARDACASVEGKATPLVLELSAFQSAVACAARVADLGLAPDVVVLNAGINTFGDLELVNGIEKMFVVNFLGHFVLTNHLLPLMREQGQGRIVHVSSRSGYRQAPPEGIDFDNLRGQQSFDAGEAYGRSKLANALFSLELADRLKGSAITSNAIHPGLVQTNIARSAPAPIREGFEWFGGLVAKSPAEGAATQVYVATSPRLEDVSGAYFEDCNPVVVTGAPHHMTDKPMAERLWAVAEQMTTGYLI